MTTIKFLDASAATDPAVLAAIAEVPVTDKDRLRVIARGFDPHTCDELVKAGAESWLHLVERDGDGELVQRPLELIAARWNVVAGADIAAAVCADHIRLLQLREETNTIAARIKQRINDALADPKAMERADLHMLGEYDSRRSVKQ